MTLAWSSCYQSWCSTSAPAAAIGPRLGDGGLEELFLGAQHGGLRVLCVGGPPLRRPRAGRRSVRAASERGRWGKPCGGRTARGASAQGEMIEAIQASTTGGRLRPEARADKVGPSAALGSCLAARPHKQASVREASARQRTREHIPSSRSVDTRINHKLIAAETLRISDAKNKCHRSSMADLAAWNDSDDDEPRRKSPTSTKCAGTGGVW